MKKIIVTLLVMTIFALIVGCFLLETPLECSQDVESPFYVVNWSTGSTETIDACIVKTGTHADFIIEKSTMSKLSQENIDELSNEFDNNIYSTVTSTFGALESDIDSNGKIYITLHSASDSVRGYINNADMDSTIIGDTNDGEYIYVNLNKSMDIIKQTMAHEFQHAVNQSYRLNNIGAGEGNLMETWLDEGLAMASEQLIYGADALSDRVESFNNDSYGNIKNADITLMNWGTETDDYASDYALSYLFVQWLDTNYTGSNLFKDIIGDASGSAGGIVSATGAGYQELLRTWASDNITDPNYGGTLAVDVQPQEPSETIYELSPSGMLYDLNNDCATAGCDTTGAGPNIAMDGVNSDGSIGDLSSADSSIVYNFNTDSNGSAESVGNWYKGIIKGLGRKEESKDDHYKKSTRDFSYNPVYPPRD